MGEIKINIPKDMETAFEEAFPGEDKATAIMRLIRAEIAKRQNGGPVAEDSFDDLVAEVMRLRDEPPYFSDDEIRRARDELRQ
jgi:cytochrome P450